MVQLIVGEKGKGKTKILLDKVNSAIKSANGNIVYLDKNSKHMYELNNKIRLIDVSSYPLMNSEQFVGFICGIISQDHDLEAMYLDGFLKIAKLEDADPIPTIVELEEISKKCNLDFIISLSVNESVLPESMKDKVLVAL